MTDKEKEEFKMIEDLVFEMREQLIRLLSRVDNLEREVRP